MDDQDVIFVDVWRVRVEGLVYRVCIPGRPTSTGLIDAFIDYDAIELQVAVPVILFKQHKYPNTVINQSINIYQDCFYISQSRTGTFSSSSY